MHVQNSMPPYMIANEAEGVGPFNAESGNTRGHVDNLAKHLTIDMTQRHQPISFEVLVAKFSEHVNVQKAMNIVPLLQRQAGIIVYVVDDLGIGLLLITFNGWNCPRWVMVAMKHLLRYTRNCTDFIISRPTQYFPVIR
ncbi:hypothetical protein AC579_2252 [Pseudocercospora musae]|uniref:Uncharacterized protein n=1 Tax=Pseudocercospora musae TaxID=113226 RepID=A0A139IUY0_9PEZI|nr:hypothetical protein AC579_2252 [Pseudocercospora musae]